VTTLEAPVLTVSNLRKTFRVRGGGRSLTLTAVDGIDLELSAGETVAIVGESGSGKSTVARCVTRLLEPTSGEVTLSGKSLTSVPKRDLWKSYADLQMVFQDPNSSLNPRMTIQQTLEEPLRLHTDLDRDARHLQARQLLEDVGLSPSLLDRYPRQLSGGQRQRIGIARALAVNPKVLILDEPTASLDVSVRGEVLDLLKRVQTERGLAYLIISHDLEVVRRVADRTLVMYLGAVVEQGPTAEVLERPTHPYTRALLSSAAIAEYGRSKTRFRLNGEITSPVDLPAGCRLSPRCPLAEPSCLVSPPATIAITPRHLVACPVVVNQPRMPTPAT
jgi:oligopeptide/dipeptide ABC transporter ATP-binding protein